MVGDPTSQNILRENSDYMLISAGYSPSTLPCSNLTTELCCHGEWGRFGAVCVFGAGVVCAVFQTGFLPFQGSCSSCFSMANQGSHPTWLSDRGSLSMFSALSQAQSGRLRCFELGEGTGTQSSCARGGGRRCIILVCSGAECPVWDRAVSLSLA